MQATADIQMETQVVPRREPNQTPKKRTTTNVDPGLLRKAGIIVKDRGGIDLFDYLDAILRPVIERDFAKTVNNLQAEAKETGR